MSKRLDLFYYTNDNVVRDSLMINAVACASFNEKLRPQSLGGIDTTAVFLTHKKLNEEQRQYGLEENGFEYPVLFKLSFLESNMSAIQCLLIENQEDGYECSQGTLADYDADKHIGAFVAAYIPLTYLTEILFQSEDEMKDIYQPSPDLWEPKKLYGIMNTEEYTDSIDIEKLIAISNENFDKEKVVKSVRFYCKQRSSLYFSLVATREWQAGKYLVNFDPYIAEMLGISNEDTDKVLEPYDVKTEEIFAEMPSDFLVDKNPVKHAVFEAVVAELFEDDNTTVYDEEKFNKVAGIIIGKLTEKNEQDEVITNYTRSLGLLKNNLYSSSGMVFDDVLAQLEEYQVLKALSVFMKNPHDVDLFAESIRSYKISQQDARVAWIFYGLVNGMRDLNGEYKTSILLNRTIDALATTMMDETMVKIDVNSTDDLETLFGDKAAEILVNYVLKAKQSLSMDEIYKFFVSEVGRAMLSYDRIKGDCPKVKGFDWKKYVYYEIPESVKPGKISKKELDDIVKLIKTEHTDKEQFYADLLSDKKLFSKFYLTAEDKWKAYYLECQKKAVKNND